MKNVRGMRITWGVHLSNFILGVIAGLCIVVLYFLAS